MDPTFTIVPYLFAITFVLAIAYAIWQYTRAKKAKREHHQSADAKVHGDKPAQPPSAL